MGNKDKPGLMINTDVLLASSKKFIFGGPTIALRLTETSLSAVKWELAKPTLQPGDSLVSERGMAL